MDKEIYESLPKTIKIAAFDIKIDTTVVNAQSGESNWGEWIPLKQTICLYDAVLVTPYKVIDTLLHEIGHAIYWAYGIYDSDKEEHVVATMATAWTQIYRDNPELLAFITSCLEQPATIDELIGINP